MPFPAHVPGFPAAEVRQADKGADQQGENDELEVFEQQSGHRSQSLLFLRGLSGHRARNVWSAA